MVTGDIPRVLPAPAACGPELSPFHPPRKGQGPPDLPALGNLQTAAAIDRRVRNRLQALCRLLDRARPHASALTIHPLEPA